MIVDFTQDPNGPFGSGNFRDESGKIFYLHDPETAQQFVKTMPGAQLSGKVKGESDDIASARMDGGQGLRGKVGLESDMIARQALGGAPQKLPDQRLASNAPTLPGTAPEQPAQPEAGGFSLTPEQQAATSASPENALAFGGAGGPPAPPQQSDPKALQVVQGFVNGQLPGSAAAAGSAPAAPAAGAAPGSEPQTSGATKSPWEAVAEFLKLGQGKAKNQTVTTTTTAYGRPDDVVDAEQGRADAAGANTNAALRANAQGSDERTQKGIEAERQGLGRASWADFDQYNRGNKEAAEAKAAVERLNQAYAANEKTLDPDRFVKNLSTGKKIGMVILAAINGAFGALAGKKNNDVLDIINAEIERDIDAQKNQIAGKRNLLSNQIAEYMRQGHDANTSVDLARDRMRANTIALAKLEREKAVSEGKDTSQMDVTIAQLEEQRNAQKDARLKEKEDRVQQAEQVTAGTQQGGGLDDVLKMIKLQNDLTDQDDAATVSKIVGSPQSPERVKELKASVRETGPGITETSAALETTKALVEQMGGQMDVERNLILLPGDKDPRTGQIVPGTLRGVGPLASRPSLQAADDASHVPVVGGLLAPVVGIGHKIGRSVGLIRTDYDRNKDLQGALSERVTNMITGANSNLRQDATFHNMVGNDFENEEATRQNLHAWANTLFAQRNGQLARLGPEGQRYYFHNLDAAQSGTTAPGAPTVAPPLRPHGQPLPAPTPAPAAQPGGAPAPAAAPADTGAAPTPRTASAAGLTPEFENAALNQADAMDLNGEHVLRVMNFETRGEFSPGTVAANSPNHAGLLQFGRQEWAEAARLGGQPAITWEAAQQMTPEQQLPFALAYLKGKGLGPDSTLDQYYTALAAPGYIFADPDTVIYERGSPEMAANPSWDANRDGHVTRGDFTRLAQRFVRPHARAQTMASR